MPDDCAVVPEPIVSRSSSSTLPAPSFDRWNATDVPTTPPPITTTSKRSTAHRSRIRSTADPRASIELPLVVDDLHDHPGALVEAEVVVLRHVDDAVADVQIADLLERIAQRPAELDRSGAG